VLVLDEADVARVAGNGHVAGPVGDGLRPEDDGPAGRHVGDIHGAPAARPARARAARPARAARSARARAPPPARAARPRRPAARRPPRPAAARPAPPRAARPPRAPAARPARACAARPTGPRLTARSGRWIDLPGAGQPRPDECFQEHVTVARSL